MKVKNMKIIYYIAIVISLVIMTGCLHYDSNTYSNSFYREYKPIHEENKLENNKIGNMGNFGLVVDNFPGE